MEIQQLVDELAERLQHSVAVDDPHGHLIASSKHFGDEDAPRVNVVLSRDLDPRVAKYLFSFGIRSATEKVVIPGKDDLGLKARCCYPLRHRRQLLGFIWLIGDHGTDEVIRPYAERIAETLGQQYAASHANADRLAELGRQLLSRTDAGRHAADGLRAEGFAADGSAVYLIAVAQPAGRSRPPSFPELLSTGPVQEWVHTGRSAIEVDLDAAAVLICAPGDGPETGFDRLLPRLADRLAQGDVRVGISAPGSLGDVQELLRQALLSAGAGHLFTDLGAVNQWDEMFTERLLLEMALAPSVDTTPPRHMAALFDASNETLLNTAETYLDHGGDRSATADALYIHRSTLYYRLSQIQKLTGLSLADGHGRLSLHLAIKLHRIAGSDIGRLVQTDEDHG
ncbi:PucR family transcriptional regulator [Saccharopolyspora shandongensis]|uniref:PucR family transcriptional regulator n=1 Tax=Saccharopolyspora shandongensis TaxID=418495 RepID=UPI0033C52DA3